MSISMLKKLKFWYANFLCLFLIATASGCGQIAELLEEDPNASLYRARLHDYQSMERFAPPQLEIAELGSIAALVSHGGSSVMSDPRTKIFVSGPFIIEGNGIKYTVGDRGGWEKQVAYLDPGTYTMTTWIEPPLYYECHIRTGGWERCPRPKTVFKESYEADPATGNLVRKTTRSHVEYRTIVDHYRIRCSVNLGAGEEVAAWGLILACWKASALPNLEPYPGEYEKKVPKYYDRIVTPVDSQQVSEEEIAVATAMISGLSAN